jgi:hypothetical protein
MEAGPTLGSMNPIALIETTAAARSAVLGALATDPVVPSPTAGSAASRPTWRSASSMLAKVQRLAKTGLGRPASARSSTRRESGTVA